LQREGGAHRLREISLFKERVLFGDPSQVLSALEEIKKEENTDAEEQRKKRKSLTKKKSGGRKTGKKKAYS